MNKKIGIIGFGNMGSAIAERLKAKYQIFVFDKDANKIKNISGLEICEEIKDLIERVDTIILAVKPQDFGNLLNEIKDSVKGKLIISIAAGITTQYMENRLGEVKAIRVMPNMPAKIGKGMTCLCRGEFTTDDDLNFSQKLFDKLGKTLILNEDMMDAATAVSGSGPGFYFDIIESRQGRREKILQEFIFSLTEAAKSIGFSPEEATLLSSTTGNASEMLIEQTKLSPVELKKQITSKGGTTEAGLEVLHKGGSLKEAVKAALKRAKELSK